MAKKRTVRVLERHIKTGVSGLRRCPVALALCAAGFKDVVVGNDRASVNGDDVELPQRVQRFIERFDVGDNVKPFEFKL